MKVTQDDLLDAIRAALTKASDRGGLTVKELAEAGNCGDEKVRRALQIIHREGRLVALGVYRIAIDGRQVKVPAYKIKEKK